MNSDQLPERALLVGPNVERTAVLGMAFDEVHVATFEDYPEHLDAQGGAWPCVVITGIPTKGGRLASLVADVLAQTSGPLDVVIDVRHPYGSDVVQAAQALRGLELVGRVDLWGVPCLRLVRASTPDAVPELSAGVEGLPVAPAAPTAYTAVPAEVTAAQIARYERRIAELEEQVAAGRVRPEPAPATAAPPGVGKAGPGRGRRLRRIVRSVRRRVAAPAPAAAAGLDVDKLAGALRAEVRRQLRPQTKSLAAVDEAQTRLAARLATIELNIAIGAASATESARRVAALPRALRAELGLWPGPEADVDLLLLLAAEVRGRQAPRIVVCDHGPLALWIARVMRHDGAHGAVFAVESDPVAAAIVGRAIREDHLHEVLEVRGPVGALGQWRNGQPLMPEPPTVADVAEVALVLAGAAAEAGPTQLTSCPLQPEQLAADPIVLLAGTWPPVRADQAADWAELLAGLRPVEDRPPGWTLFSGR